MTGDHPRYHSCMLPGLKWVPRHQYASREIALELDGKQVAMLLARNDGGWFARLEAHWPIEAPLISRPCTSFDSGKAGVEQWATRHIDRLRAELADPLVARRNWSLLVPPKPLDEGE